MATNKTTVSVYADDDLLAALNQFKDSGNHKSLNVAIVAILREKLFGEATDNVQSKVQGNVSSTLDIDSKINEAIAATMGDIDSKINDAVTNAIAAATAKLEAKVIDIVTNQESAVNTAIGGLREQIKDVSKDLTDLTNSFSGDMKEIGSRLTDLETVRSEAIAPAKKPLMQIAREKVMAA